MQTPYNVTWRTLQFQPEISGELWKSAVSGRNRRWTVQIGSGRWKSPAVVGQNSVGRVSPSYLCAETISRKSADWLFFSLLFLSFMCFNWVRVCWTFNRYQDGKVTRIWGGWQFSLFYVPGWHLSKFPKIKPTRTHFFFFCHNCIAFTNLDLMVLWAMSI